MRIELTSDLLTGFPTIDQQHRELVEWTNALQQERANGGRAANVREAIRFLAEYVEYHFAEEEAAMATTGYAEGPAHAKGHRWFTSQLKEMRRELVASQDAAKAALRLHFLMSDWFVQHIRQADRRLAAWLRESGHEVASEGLSVWEFIRRAGIDPRELAGVEAIPAGDMARPVRRPQTALGARSRIV